MYVPRCGRENQISDKWQGWKGAWYTFMNIRDEKCPLMCLEVIAVLN